MSDELSGLDAEALTVLLRARQVSAAELLDQFFQRIDRLNPQINAFTALGREAARAEAGDLDRAAARGSWRGPLHGLPYAVKDVFDVAGLATTFGCAALSGNLAARDAIHVARMRAAGAIIIGKTNLPEFALGCQTTNRLVGTTRNPLDLSKSVAGSSGGAAAALAAGMTMFADGSDLGGSVRSPAAWTGTVGLRPSNGTVPWRTGHAPLLELHVPGPMARSVDDLARMFDVMRGADRHAARSWNLSPASTPKADAPRKLAWSLTPCGARTDPAIAAVLHRALVAIEVRGHQLEEFCPAIGDMAAAQQVFRSLNAFVEAGPAIDGRELQFARPLVEAVLEGRDLTREQISRAMRIQADCWSKMTAAFERFDFLIWPTTCGPAYSADLDGAAIEEDWTPVILTPGLGIPALSMPAGELADGMPVGLQIIGARGSDLDLIAFARELEAILPTD